MYVSHHAGEWIEITCWIVTVTVLIVSPHAGEWIEIHMSSSSGSRFQVSPHAGEWIEIWFGGWTDKVDMSLPMRESGLK